VIAPVIPPQSPLQELVYGPLVTNRAVRPADDALAYGLCSVGGRPDPRQDHVHRAGLAFDGTRVPANCCVPGPSDQQSDLSPRIAGRRIRNDSCQVIALAVQVERDGDRENRDENRGNECQAGERLGAGHAVDRHAAHCDDDRDAGEDAPCSTGFRVGH
jgi:hypothetical protein